MLTTAVAAPATHADEEGADRTACICTSVKKRTLFPNGFSTVDLVETYTRLAPALLAHLRARPLTLKRFPDTLRGEAFWEKDAPSFTPKWVKRVDVPRKAGGDPIHYIAIPDLKTLRWTASVGCVEIHSFLHKYPYITSPTLIAFDLDPGEGVNVIDCCDVALRVRHWFQQHGLESFPKVSGSKGLQVYVPLNTVTSYGVTQRIAKSVAEELERDAPSYINSRMARADRRGKVFIDWSQNAEHKTTISVYSVRAKRPQPFVSMPLTWAEVEAALHNGKPAKLDFGPEAAIARVKQLGDLFADVISLKQHIPDALLTRLRLQRPAPPVAVQVPKQTQEARSLPRSSGQGGRKLFVIHLATERYELGIEHKDAFRLFTTVKIPAVKNGSSETRETGTMPLRYLTDESQGMVWDLGTFEVVEGSLEKGHLAIYLSGRKLNGEWLLRRNGLHWTLTNTSGTLRRNIPASSSALAGIDGLRHTTSKHAAA